MPAGKITFSEKTVFAAAKAAFYRCGCGCGRILFLLSDRHNRIRACAAIAESDLIKIASAPSSLPILNAQDSRRVHAETAT